MMGVSRVYFHKQDKILIPTQLKIIAMNPSAQVVIQTSRLILKGITPAFINEIFESCTKQEIMTLFNSGESGYELLRQMHEMGMETHRISMFYFLLVDKVSQTTIGDCGFHSWNKTHRRAELFYNLWDDSHKRQGIMSEALAEVLAYGFKKMNLHRIEAMAAKENHASVNLLKRFGFSWEGTMREDYVVDGVPDDSECYSLLQPEWEDFQKKQQA